MSIKNIGYVVGWTFAVLFNIFIVFPILLIVAPIIKLFQIFGALKDL